MSGIAGMFNFDGRPVDAALLRRMTGAMAHRGPDGAAHWVRGPTGLGHVMLHTTPESLLEQQPLTDDAGALCLVLDGRVDNREELRRSLESNGARLRSDTDAELVLQAYGCWGEDCPARIIGDFAFAIWNNRKRRLFCARDALGVKPFYYYCSGTTFLFSSELHALFQDPDVRRIPNEGMVGEYLANSFASREETLFQGILRLPQANSLVVESSGSIRKTQYWDADPARETRYRNDQEYAEAFGEVFQEAVRCRMRSHRPVGSELSGGLDSSSISCVAESLRRQGRVSSTGLETFSLVFPGLPCDESGYIRDVTEKWNLASNCLEVEAADSRGYREQVMRYQDFPYPPNGQMHHPMMTLAKDKGIRVLLSGAWGDQWLTGSLYHNADLLRRLQIGKLLRQIKGDSYVYSQLGCPESPAYMLLRYGIWPLLPRWVRQGVKAGLNRKQAGVPRWITGEFARRTQLAARIQRQDLAGRRWPTHAQREPHVYLVSGRSAFQREANERFASSYGMEVRYPFQDRRLIEFALGLPEEQRWRRDRTKFILRQAMEGVLPESVRLRYTKADFSHVLAEGLQSLGGEDFIHSMEISRMGWVDAQQVRLMYRDMIADYVQDGPYSTHTVPLWFLMGIELWKRHAFPQNGFSVAPSEQPLAVGLQGG